MLDIMEKPKSEVPRTEEEEEMNNDVSILDHIEEEEEKNNDDSILDHIEDEDSFEGLNDWGVPANYNSLRLKNELGQESIWQCVKRPWTPTDAQLTPAQKDAKKKKERNPNKLPGDPSSVTGNTEFLLGDEDDVEPGDDDKFHYYWRLSKSELYARAGAVGMHWRAIRYPQTKMTKLNSTQEDQSSIRVGWINQVRWSKFCEGRANSKSVVIHIIDNKSMVMTPEDISSIEIPVNANDKREALIKYVNVELAADKNLQKEAQELMTEDSMIKAEMETAQSGLAHSSNTAGISIFTTDINNDSNNNVPPADPDLPFRFTDGTFAYSCGAFAEAPTMETIDGEKVTDRLYVKLRRKDVKRLEVSGGLFNPVQGDTFILKTKLDELAGMVVERDPTMQALGATAEQAQWKSDSRDQLIQEPKVDTKTARDQRSEARKESRIWVRNSNGFAFQFFYKKMELKGWNKYRRDSIASLDEDRGWNRYIDPPIPLYIVPCSTDEHLVSIMHISIVKAMKYLDMPVDFLKVDSGVKKTAKNLLVKLRKAHDANPDCATKMVHLIMRSGIVSEQLVQVSRLSHSFLNTLAFHTF